jgi:hypothetical protein
MEVPLQVSGSFDANESVWTKRQGNSHQILLTKYQPEEKKMIARMEESYDDENAALAATSQIEDNTRTARLCKKVRFGGKGNHTYFFSPIKTK